MGEKEANGEKRVRVRPRELTRCEGQTWPADSVPFI
jgi:hypothetical protein